MLSANARAIVYAQFVESDQLRARYAVQDSCGFDLGAFNRLKDPRVLQLDLRRFEYQALCSPIPILDIDFEADELPLSGRELGRFDVHQTGRADGVIFWYDLILDPVNNIIMSTAPDQEGTHWMQGFCPLYDEQPLLTEGEQRYIACAYERFLLWFQLV